MRSAAFHLTLLGLSLLAISPKTGAQALQAKEFSWDISLHGEWGDKVQCTEIVTIGRLEGMESASLQNKFEQCLS